MTRDRAEAYASGIRAGAPDALQVADRRHLLNNLTDALTVVFQEHDHDLRQLRHAKNPGKTSLCRLPHHNWQWTLMNPRWLINVALIVHTEHVPCESRDRPIVPSLLS